ncbi:hypothetical protein B6U74_05080 [Candidatus Bathyarchaeota archaeon ex4484_205]|nr:MAG: hypothetical protein B6U74_05080 [Candidatus Bathyarchaeota archaeon ex4484_205]RLF96173.1 MAG: hypothetical protein DRN52_02850 [Thermococci archaeon]
MGRKIVVDEWIYYYFSRGEYPTLLKFLKKVKCECHKIVLERSSRIEKKIFRISKESYRILEGRDISRLLFGGILQDSEKCEWISKRRELDSAIKEKIHRKDIYLVELAISSKSEIVITTDRELCEAISENLGIECVMPEEFLSDE